MKAGSKAGQRVSCHPPASHARYIPTRSSPQTDAVRGPGAPIASRNGYAPERRRAAYLTAVHMAGLDDAGRSAHKGPVWGRAATCPEGPGVYPAAVRITLASSR